jgi:hypothetical protein
MSSLKEWLQSSTAGVTLATGSNVSALRSISGSTPTFSNTNGSHQAVLTQRSGEEYPSLEFDGTTPYGYVYSGSNPDWSTAWSIAVVFRENVGATTGGIFGGFKDSDGHTMLWRDSGLKLQHGEPFSQMVLPDRFGVWRLAIASFDGTNKLKCEIDGVRQADVTVSNNSSNSSAFVIGSIWATNTAYCHNGGLKEWGRWDIDIFANADLLELVREVGRMHSVYGY